MHHHGQAFCSHRFAGVWTGLVPDGKNDMRDYACGRHIGEHNLCRKQFCHAKCRCSCSDLWSQQGKKALWGGMKDVSNNPEVWKKNQAEGWCLYQAIADGRHSQWQEVKDEILNEYREQGTKLPEWQFWDGNRPVLPEAPAQSKEEYVAELARDEAWGSAVELKIYARLHDLTAVIEYEGKTTEVHTGAKGLLVVKLRGDHYSGTAKPLEALCSVGHEADFGQQGQNGRPATAIRQRSRSWEKVVMLIFMMLLPWTRGRKACKGRHRRTSEVRRNDTKGRGRSAIPMRAGMHQDEHGTAGLPQNWET